MTLSLDRVQFDTAHLNVHPQSPMIQFDMWSELRMEQLMSTSRKQHVSLKHRLVVGDCVLGEKMVTRNDSACTEKMF